MTPDQFALLKALFAEAVEHPDRLSGIRQRAAGDPDVADALERLLRADGQGDVVRFLETPPALGELDALPEPAPRIGPYTIQREVGRGGMSVVYLGTRDDLANRGFAIKLLRGEAAAPHVLARYQRERDTLARLDHPNIARLVDGGADANGRPYLVMTFVDGQPLDRHCREARPSVDDRLRIFRTICDAVQYAHQNLVIHRDLKPGNILIDRTGQPRLVDFGIAKILQPLNEDQNEVDPTRTSLRALTPAYASPEQLSGAAVSTASDVYSLGVVLYELLTGHRPHDTPTHTYRPAGQRQGDLELPAASTIAGRPGSDRSAALAPPLSPRALRRRLTGDLDAILNKALQGDPARRYTSAQQLGDDVDRHLKGLPVIAKPDGALYRAAKFVRRHRVGVAAAALAATSILGAAAVVTYQGLAAARASARAERLSAFLQQVFLSADPTEGRRDITVIESLEKAGARARTELANDPDTLAEIQLNIGRTLLELGQPDKSAPLIKEAFSDSLARHGERHPITIRAMLWSGMIDHIQGRNDEAERTLRRSVDLADAALAEDDGLRGETRQYLAVVLIDRGRDRESVALTKAAIDVFELTPAKYATTIGTLKNNLAVSAYNQGRLDEARGLYEEALAIHRANHHDALSAPVLVNLGVVYRLQGKLADAERVLREGLDLRIKTLGAPHPNVAIARVHLGDTLMRAGRLAEARVELDQALAAQRAALPPGHIDLARSTSVLGLLRCRDGQAADGERLLGEALTIRQAQLPKGHWLTASVQSAMGECLALMGRRADALPLLLEAAKNIDAALGPTHPTTLEARTRVTTFGR